MATNMTHRFVPLRASCFEVSSGHGFQMFSSLCTTSCHFMRSQNGFQRTFALKMDFKSFNRREDGNIALELHDFHVPLLDTCSAPSHLQFHRLQLDKEISPEEKIEFGQFMAREAIVDEEYWTAAWLRAESHWENRHERYANNYKRKFAEEEFNALKRRSRAQLGQKSTCIVAVRKEHKNVKLSVLKSVVGTLDVRIQQGLHGEKFPRERMRKPLFSSINRKNLNRYGYVVNLCVAKSSRRQGIASNMLHFAIRLAKANDVEQVFVHVHQNNTSAQRLYEKLGFEVCERASRQLLAEQTYLLCLKI